MSNNKSVQGDNFTVEQEKSPVEKLVDALVDSATALAGDTLSKEERLDEQEKFKIAEEGLSDAMEKRDGKAQK